MDIDDEWELDESSDEEEEAGNKPVKIKEEVLSESEAETQQASAPEMVIKVEKLDPELDSWSGLPLFYMFSCQEGHRWWSKMCWTA